MVCRAEARITVNRKILPIPGSCFIFSNCSFSQSDSGAKLRSSHAQAFYLGTNCVPFQQTIALMMYPWNVHDIIPQTYKLAQADKTPEKLNLKPKHRMCV